MSPRERDRPGPQDLVPELRGSSRFEILGHLGSGGMGVVYAVYDRQRQARLALKTLRVSDGPAIVRLKREFRALQDLQHPNLVTLGDLVETGGLWFFTMELVPGTGFLEHVRPGRAVTGPGLTSLELGRTIESSEDLPGWPVHVRPPSAGGTPG